MRKKLLSLLTVLCLVLGMLPATAMAADAVADLGYSEEDIAMTISEDTELTEDVEGLVLVVAPVKVTVKDAKLTVGLVVADTAKGATVVLGENADVNAVIVMGTAEVVVEETAVAASITVAAAETTVTVAGTVATVTVTEVAENTAVTVAETAKVETVAVAAPAATVEVAGTVASVTVAETATGVELVVAETAAVTEVTDNSGELTVSGDGAESVTVNDATAKDDEGEDEEPAEESKEDEGEDEEPAEESKEDEDKTGDAAPVIGNNPAPGIVADPHVADPGFKAAPLVDHPASGTPKTDLASKYGVFVDYNGDNDVNEFNVVITAQNLKNHANGAHTNGNWVGLAIPVPTDTSYKYAFYVYKITAAGETPTGIMKSEGINWDANNDGTVDYKTMYFGLSSETKNTTQYRVEVAKIKADDEAPEADAFTPEYVLNLSFAVTLYGEEDAQAAAAAAALWNSK